MTVNPELANTLILAVIEIDAKAFCVGNLTTEFGMEKDAVMIPSDSALQATKAALHEALMIKPAQILILSNKQSLVDTYTHPIRLPLNRPKDLEQYYNPRGGMYRNGAWNIPDEVVKQSNLEWDVMRLLCNFNRWQFKYLHENNMKRTKELWQQHYMNEK